MIVAVMVGALFDCAMARQKRCDAIGIMYVRCVWGK